jgi:hypothetical protein
MTLKGKALSGGTVTLIDDTVITEQPSTSPSEPRSVSATAGNTSAVVSWSAPTSNGGSAITGYTVTSSPGGRFTAVSCVGCGDTGGCIQPCTNSGTNSRARGFHRRWWSVA